MFATAEAHGPFGNEKLIGEALALLRDRVVIATKFLRYAFSKLLCNSNKGHTI